MNFLVFLAGAVVGAALMTAAALWYLWHHRPNW